MATAPRERFDIGRVASLTFGVIGRNAVLFLAFALVLSGLPAFALARSTVETAGGSVSAQVTWFLGSTLATLILGALLQAILVVATLQDLSGQRVDAAACLKRPLLMALSLIGLTILMWLGIGAAAFLLFFPALIVYVMWFVAVPALVEERRGVIAALGRSRRLTAGARWPIFGMVVAFLVLSITLSVLPSVARLTPDSIGHAIFQAVLSTLASLVASTGVAATYVELRTVKEGANVDALAAIFA